MLEEDLQVIFIFIDYGKVQFSVIVEITHSNGVRLRIETSGIGGLFDKRTVAISKIYSDRSIV